MKPLWRYGFAALIAVCLLAIFQEFGISKAAYLDDSLDTQGQAKQTLSLFIPLSEPEVLDKPKALLGRALFSDSRLSKGNQISCQSCHNLEKGGADSKQFSLGVGNSIGIVNSPTVFNSSLNFKQFWDGREENLSGQIDGPIHNSIEMNSNWPEIVEKLKADKKLVTWFKNVFNDEISKDRIVDAIVEFEKALITLDSPFDNYLRGEPQALTEAQVKGFKKFQEYGCIACHQGQNLGGNMFQSMGVAFDYFAERGGSFESDKGRFSVTKLSPDLHVFKVPSLRNVELTAPYFHDGTESSLENAVKKMARYQLGRELPKEDIGYIADFLKSLTGKQPRILREANNALEK